MGDRYLCTCTLCGPGGMSQSRSTAQRHRFDDKLRSSGSGVLTVHASPSPQPPQRLAVPVLAPTTEADDFPQPDTPDSSPPSISTTIERLTHYLRVRDAAWRFPASLVFATPPTEDSLDFTPRTVAELRYPNSTFPLSLRDQESAQVIGYESFLNETLQVLESHSLHEDDPLTAQITESVNTTLNILATLDKHKGAEWDRQVRAQRSPDTYVLTGVYIPSAPYPMSH